MKIQFLGRRAAVSAFTALMAACTTRELPTRYPKGVPASLGAPAPRAPAAAVALEDEPAPGASTIPAADAAAPAHPHGAHHGH